MKTGVFDPFDPDFVQNPYPVYAWLRQHEPLHRSPTGYWVLSRYEDIVAAMKDPRLSNQPSRFAVTHARNREKYTAADVANNIIPFLDPPQHDAPRKALTRAFQQQLKQVEVDLPQQLEALRAPLKTGKTWEFLHDFATPLSIRFMSRFLGLPASDEKQLVDWSHWFFYLFAVIPSEEVLQSVNQALSEFRQYLQQQLSMNRDNPRPGLISRLLDDPAGGLKEEEIVDSLMLIFADGVENVDSALANTVLALLQNPDALQQLQANPALIPAAIDESLRYNSPAQFIAKVAKEAIEWHGKIIRPQQAVFLVLGSANHDETRFDDADRFLLDRPKNQHLSLGKGRHACIGAPLVKMELHQALLHLLPHLQRCSLIEEPQWQTRLGHRWLKRLPLRID